MVQTDSTQIQPEIKELIKIFGDDHDLFLFYLKWIENGLNATKAYEQLHPNVNHHSASVLGAKLLGKISKNEVMGAYQLDLGVYMQQLKDGLKAMKVNEFTGELFPDHIARKPYHDKLGKHLGLETEAGKNAVNINFISLDQFMSNFKKEVEQKAEDGEIIE